MSCKVKRTYKSRQSRNPTSSSVPAPSINQARKRSLEEHSPLSLTTNLPPFKRAKTTSNPSPDGGKKPRTLTQLHFCIDQTILRTCSQCGLTYTKGAPDDDVLHRAHCARVQKGMEWGREEEKETLKYGVMEVHRGVKLKDGRKGRIICFRADVGGKIGSKVCPSYAMQRVKFDGNPLAEHSAGHRQSGVVLTSAYIVDPSSIKSIPLPSIPDNE
jgi:N-acetyltransferase